MGWGNPVVGGTVLLREAIQSPNFSQGPPIVGWAIEQNGSAFFGNVTVSGSFMGTDFIINSSGAFFYSGTPAHGNLIASIASAAGTDGFSNAYQAGITSYDNTFGGVTQLNGAQFSLFSGVNLVIKYTQAGMFFYKPKGAAGNLVESIAPAAGTDAFGNAYLSGHVTYVNNGGTFFAVQQDSQAFTDPVIAFYTAATEAGPWTATGSISSDQSGGLFFSFGADTSPGLQLQSGLLWNQIQRAPGTDPITGLNAGWRDAAADGLFQTGWSNRAGGPNVRYRMDFENRWVEVQGDCQFNCTAGLALASPQNILSMSGVTGYTPSRAQNIQDQPSLYTQVNLTIAANGLGVAVTNTGNIQLIGGTSPAAAGNGVGIRINGRYALD